jgi:hypothetical protein
MLPTPPGQDWRKALREQVIAAHASLQDWCPAFRAHLSVQRGPQQDCRFAPMKRLQRFPEERRQAAAGPVISPATPVIVRLRCSPFSQPSPESALSKSRNRLSCLALIAVALARIGMQSFFHCRLSGPASPRQRGGFCGKWARADAVRGREFLLTG